MSILYFNLHDLELTTVELFYDERPINEKADEFERIHRLKRLTRDLIEHNQEKFDWKYFYDNGWLCEADFDENRFKEELNNLGLYLEDYKTYCNKKYNKVIYNTEITEKQNG